MSLASFVLLCAAKLTTLSIDCHREVTRKLRDLVLVALHLDDGPRSILV